MFQPQLMQGQRILVTGGGTGLGQAMADNFLSLGADIAICGRRKSVCDETAAAWREKFPGRMNSAEWFSCDWHASHGDQDGVSKRWQSHVWLCLQVHR